MTKALLVDFTIHPDHADTFAAAIAVNARTSVATEPGCLQFNVSRDPTNAGQFFLYEVYHDDTAFQAHMASAHFRTFDATTAGWVVAKTVRLFDRLVP